MACLPLSDAAHLAGRRRVRRADAGSWLFGGFADPRDPRRRRVPASARGMSPPGLAGPTSQYSRPASAPSQVFNWDLVGPTTPLFELAFIALELCSTNRVSMRR